MAEESKAESLTKEVEAEVKAEAVKGKAVAEDVKGEATAESVPTVREIFALPEKDTDPRSAEWKEFQERIRKEAKAVRWTATMPDLAEKVCELLDIKIPNILVAAWKKAHELQTVLEKSRSTPDEVIYLGLAEHIVNSDHKPSIDVRLKGATVKTIELPVQLAFKLQGFVLKIQNGGIKEMRTGHCEAKGTIKYGKLTIAEKKLEPIKLPFSIPIPSAIQYLTPSGENEPVQLEKKAITAAAAKGPVNDIERIEL
jgi:hypothetical protein